MRDDFLGFGTFVSRDSVMDGNNSDMETRFWWLRSQWGGSRSNRMVLVVMRDMETTMFSTRNF